MSEPSGTHPELAAKMTNADSSKQISRPAARLGGAVGIGGDGVA